MKLDETIKHRILENIRSRLK